jgi:general secretion pathway protein G
MSKRVPRIMGRIARHRIARPSSCCISPAQISRFKGARASVAVDNIPCSRSVPTENQETSRCSARVFKLSTVPAGVQMTSMSLMRSQQTSLAARSRLARGFTLIEIMVVITILGVLAALIVPRVVGRTDDAKIAAAKQDIASIMQALKLYRLDNGRYPTTDQGLLALIAKPTTEPVPSNWKQGGYIERSTVPTDPWGEPYKYLNPGIRGEIDVFSLGRDKTNGGEGPDADIGSWAL